MHHLIKSAPAANGIVSSLFVTAKKVLSGKKTMLSMLFAGMVATGSYAQGTWAPLVASAPDYNQGVMLLLTDGTILVKTSAGGGGGTGSGWNRLTPDVHGSYINGTW